MEKPEIYGIHHVSIKSRNEAEFNEAVHFYRDILGLPIARQWGNEKSPVNIMFATGNGFVELCQNAVDEPVQGSIKHFALSVKNADVCAEAVRANGYKVTMGPKNVTLNSNPPLNIRIVFCNGPLNEEIEFFQILE